MAARRDPLQAQNAAADPTGMGPGHRISREAQQQRPTSSHVTAHSSRCSSGLAVPLMAPSPPPPPLEPRAGPVAASACSDPASSAGELVRCRILCAAGHLDRGCTGALLSPTLAALECLQGR